MKFILRFFFFGLLFYGIWAYSPTSFDILVKFAETCFSYLESWVQEVIAWFNQPPA